MKNILKKSLLIMTVLGCISLTGCGNKKDSSEKTDVRVAYFPNITHTQALVMKEKQTLEEKLGDNCNVKWQSFNAGPAEVEAIFAGEIDLGYIGPVPAVNAYIKSKGDVKIIAGAANGGAVLVSKDDSINSIEDLSGKNVAIPQLGNTQHLSLLNLLTEHNLSPVSNGGDVNIIASDNSNIKTLMDQGEVDAALVPEPWGSILERDLGAKVVLDYDDIWMEGNYAVTVVVARKDFMEDHPDIVKSFIEAHKDTTVYINDNLSEAQDIVNKQIEETTSKTFDKDILGSAFSRIVLSADIPKDSIMAFAQLNLEQDFIEELPNEDIIDDSYLK